MIDTRETYKKIEDHPGYEVSNMGHVRNCKTGKVLVAYIGPGGYLNVKLDGQNCKVHILVAKAFIPNPDNLPIVNHKKGKKTDPRASQLEWCTQSENIKHAWDMGLIKKRRNKHEKYSSANT